MIFGYSPDIITCRESREFWKSFPPAVTVSFLGTFDCQSLNLAPLKRQNTVVVAAEMRIDIPDLEFD